MDCIVACEQSISAAVAHCPTIASLSMAVPTSYSNALYGPSDRTFSGDGCLKGSYCYSPMGCVRRTSIQGRLFRMKKSTMVSLGC